MPTIPSQPAGEPARRMLRAGVIVDDWFIPAWAYRALEQARQTGLVDFSLVFLNGAAGRCGAMRAGNLRKRSIFALYDALDRKLFCRTSGALQPKDLRMLLPDVPGISLGPGGNVQGGGCPPGAIEQIGGAGLDLLIQIGSGGLRGPILNSSKHGVWAYYHAEPGTRGGNPPGFWETAQDRRETGASLLRLMDGSTGRQVLQQLRFSTYPFSPARNQEYCLWASSSLLSRQIRLLSRTEEASQGHGSDARQPKQVTFNPLPCPDPSALRTLQAASRVFTRNLWRIPKRVFRSDQWSLLYDLNNTRPGLLQNYRRIIPPSDRFWADPHVVQQGESYYVFFEDYSYRTRKGHISVVEIDSDGNVGRAMAALQEPYHLSYPSVFPWSGKHYMVPESSENRTIDLYECVSFPNKWQKKMTLMEHVSAVDTTLFHYNGKWWMFTAMAENEEAFPNVELFIFHSDELLSQEWRPHAQNPVNSDGTRARPAGAIFLEGDRIYRPSQDCSKSYGYGFDINEITVLSETDFSERTVNSIRPGPDSPAKATHTFARAGRLSVVDALYTRPIWPRKWA
jgi:hypothetical protein